MATKKQVLNFDIEANTINCDISYRGGTLKVNVSELFPYIENPIMGAYQNYLGGGIAGAIVGASMFNPEELHKRDIKAFEILKERIKRHFHALNNGGGDEYMQENYSDYSDNQNLPASAY